MNPIQTPPASKADFLARVHTAYARLQTLITPIDDAGLLLTLDDGWTLKDVLAHVADWERYVVLRVDARRRADVPPVWGPDDDQVDAKNAELLAENRALTLDAVRGKAREAHAAVLAMIESLSDAELLDDSQREAVIGAWGSPVWLHLAANTYLHYEEHADTVRGWLDRTSHV